MSALRHPKAAAGAPAPSVVDFPARPEWHVRAACRPGRDIRTDVELWGHVETFFPTRERGAMTRQRIANMLPCGECFVRVECEQAGATETHGIWGGHTQRGQIRHRGQSA